MAKKKSPTLVPGQHGQALEDRLASELQDTSGSTALKTFPVSLKTGDLIFYKSATNSPNHQNHTSSGNARGTVTSIKPEIQICNFHQVVLLTQAQHYV